MTDNNNDIDNCDYNDNIKFELNIKEKQDNNQIPSYDDIVELVNNEDEKIEEYDYLNEVDMMQAYVCDYDFNYKKTELVHIAKYYEISIRKKNKIDLIHEIVEFESNTENLGIVNRRKLLWDYIEEIKSDPYLSNFIHNF